MTSSTGASLLVLLAIPPVVSVVTHMSLDQVRYEGLDAWWAAARITVPLLHLPFSGRGVQKAGLGVLNLVQVVGLVEGLIR